MNKARLIAILLSVPLCFAVKPRYGGEVSIRLNEPASFQPSASNYSNLIFYSLIYENFFFVDRQGGIRSHLFRDYRYDPSTRRLLLELKPNLSFSNGTPISGRHIETSLKIFLNLDLLAAMRLNKLIKSVSAANDQIRIELWRDEPNIVSLLTEPDLVVLSDAEKHSFSGEFYPSEWEKGSHLVLKANIYYPGGRSYLDAVKVIFKNEGTPDIFISDPAMKPPGFQEFPSGIYQNFYLCFPQSGVGMNTRIALYTLFRQFNVAMGTRYQELNALVADDESPVAIRIKAMPSSRVKTLLRQTDITLYALTSLSSIEEDFNAYLNKNNMKISLVFVDDTQLRSFISNSTAKVVLINKIFQKKTAIGEKISRIIKELSFSQFNEKYLRLLSELEETALMHNDETMLEQVAKVTETIVADGFILPLFQKSYSLYVTDRLQGHDVDSFGRPLLHQAKVSEASGASGASK